MYRKSYIYIYFFNIYIKKIIFPSLPLGCSFFPYLFKETCLLSATNNDIK